MPKWPNIAEQLSFRLRSLDRIYRSSLAGDTAVYVGSTIVNAAIPFLLLPFLARWLGPSDFGLTALFFAAVNVMAVFIGLSAHGMISVTYFRDGPEALAPQTGAAVGISVVMYAVMLLAISILPRSALGILGVPETWLWAVMLTAMFQSIQMAASAVFQTRRQPLLFAAAQIGYGVGLATMTVVLIGWQSYDWTGRALAQMIAAGSISILALIVLSSTKGINWNVTSWRMREALHFGVPLLPHAIGGVAMASIDRFALANTEGTVAVGRYFVAMQIASLMLVLATAASQAWSPWLFERLALNGNKEKRDIVKLSYLIFSILGLFGVFIALAAPIIVRIVAGPGYESAIGLLRILAPAYAFIAMYHFVTGFLFYEKRTGLLSIITITVALLQTALCFGLGKLYGPTGVATGTLLAYFIYFQLVWYFARRLHPLSWRFGIFR